MRVFFEKIDNNDKSYIFGLFMSDGYHSEKFNTIRLSLQERDKEILKKINKKINSNRPLKKIIYDQYNTQWYLSISNKKISNNLKKYGMIQNKSLTLKFPIFLSDDLLPSFLRGMIDGDGCVYINRKRKTGKVTLVSSKFFINKLIIIIEEKLNIHCSKYTGSNYNINTKGMVISGNKQTEKFLDWIYEDINNGTNNLYIERKYKKYLELKDMVYQINNKPKTLCKICGKEQHAKSLCKLHYQQYRRKLNKEKILTI